MISIITSTIGRELYLSRLLKSASLLGDWANTQFEWKIVFQGGFPSMKMLNLIDSLAFRPKVEIETDLVVRHINNIIYDFQKTAKYNLYLKLDDDALICSPDFFSRIVELSELIPKSVIYPLEIGGYTNIQAPLSEQQVVYGSRSDVFYTVSNAILPSALSVMCPIELLRKTFLPEGQTDAQFLFASAKQNNYQVVQLQNGLIVEHQEGSAGQFYRSQMEGKGQRV